MKFTAHLRILPKLSMSAAELLLLHPCTGKSSPLLLVTLI